MVTSMHVTVGVNFCDRPRMRICKVKNLCINTWIAWLIHRFLPVKTWLLIMCVTVFYVIIKIDFSHWSIYLAGQNCYIIWGARIAQSVACLFLLDTSATQVWFSLAALANISISETIIKLIPAVVCINGLTVTFGVVVVSQGISRPNAENCTGFPHPTDGVLEAELLKSDWHLSPVFC